MWSPTTWKIVLRRSSSRQHVVVSLDWWGEATNRQTQYGRALGQEHPEDIVDKHHAQKARCNPHATYSNLRQQTQQRRTSSDQVTDEWVAVVTQLLHEVNATNEPTTGSECRERSSRYLVEPKPKVRAESKTTPSSCIQQVESTGSSTW
jgi:hypothetical protein